ncbi:MAG TPA: hypothetical protein VGY97_08350 [Solirubrobacteraceae bacterium]|jgi:hypothetical protein|nr:hypothetical protein [Solirubrobacteraceae bacterium]
MPVDATQTLRGALAGAVGAAVWAAQTPLDRRVFGCEFDDVELLGKAVTRAPAWRPVGLALHLTNGALFGALYANLTSKMPLPSWARGPFAATVENFVTWPLMGVSDRAHPARKQMPPLLLNTRALAQSTWRHLLFGVILGELERRLNTEPAAELLEYEQVVSPNGHGSLEHAISA